MRLSPDEMIFWQYGFLKLNATIVFTWGLMLVLAVGSRLITRRLSTDLHTFPLAEPAGNRRHRASRNKSKTSACATPEKYLGFLGTLFLFVATASLCTIIPGYEPPTGSLSTTAALALCVFVAVPFFGIKEQGRGRLPQVLRRSRRSSCCRSTSSAKFRARWPWRCACSAT